MKIMWITNVPVSDSPIPEQKISPFGGWIEAGFIALSTFGGYHLTICSPAKVDRPKFAKGSLASHVAIPANCTVEQMRKVLQTEAPDIVHIHGTELPHAAAAVAACSWARIPTVTSIQGLLGPYSSSSAFYHGIPARTRYGFSVKDALKRQNVALLRRDFIRRSRSEKYVLNRTTAAIGRTNWDRDCVAAINPALRYFSCNESLRPAFYEKVWSRDGAVRYSILLAQGNYPIKGAHLAIGALPIIRDKFPSAVLTIAGHDPTHSDQSLGRLRRSAYGDYLLRLVREHRLEDNVRFVGLLAEKEMLREFMRTHVSLNASSIENSPNSLGEAMLLGVPTVTPYAGGMPSMIDSSSTAFYPAGDHYSLAGRVKQVFEDDEYAMNLSISARKVALRTHDGKRNALVLSDIYQEIAG